MKRLGMILACCAAMALAGGTLHSVEEQEAPKKADKGQEPVKEKGSALRAAHAIMAKVCELSEDQKKEIAKIRDAGVEAAKQWKQDNAEKLKELQESLNKAKEAGDEEAIKKATAELAAVKAQLAAISKKTRAEIMAVLTDEQKAKWHKYSLFTSVKRRFKAANLTDEQIEQIKALCDKTDPNVDLSDDKARLKVLHSLYAQVEKDILTDEQREAVAPKRLPEPTTKPYGYPPSKPPAAKQ